MSLLQEKQEYLDKENRRLECELKKKELVLTETRTNQEHSERKRQVSKSLLRYRLHMNMLVALCSWIVTS